MQRVTLSSDCNTRIITFYITLSVVSCLTQLSCINNIDLVLIRHEKRPAMICYVTFSTHDYILLINKLD